MKLPKECREYLDVTGLKPGLIPVGGCRAFCWFSHTLAQINKSHFIHMLIQNSKHVINSSITTSGFVHESFTYLSKSLEALLFSTAKNSTIMAGIS